MSDDDLTSIGAVINHYEKLYAAGNYAQALDLIGRASQSLPGYAPLTAIWRVCMLARLGRHTQAVHLLAEAAALGYWYHPDALRHDPDLVLLKDIPEYADIVRLNEELRNAALSSARPNIITYEPQAAPPPWPLLLALHGDLGNAGLFAPEWKEAAAQGWLVAVPQSSQISWLSGFYEWRDPEKSLAEVRGHMDTLKEHFAVDPGRVVLAGFSRGSVLAYQWALEGALPVYGAILVEGWGPDVDLSQWTPSTHTQQNPGLRLALLGGDDFFIEAEQVYGKLQARGIPCLLERTSNVHHGFASDFDISLRKALAFIDSPGS